MIELAILICFLGVWIAITLIVFRKTSNPGRRAAICGLMLVAFVVSSCFAFFLINFFFPPLRLQISLMEFRLLPLPPRTSVIETQGRSGNVFARSNNCDYFIGQVLTTNLNDEQMKAHYSQYFMYSLPSFKEPVSVEPYDFQTWGEIRTDSVVGFFDTSLQTMNGKPSSERSEQRYIIWVNVAGGIFDGVYCP